MKLGLAETLKKISEAPTYRQRLEAMRQHDSWALRAVFSLALDPRYVWDFEKGWKPEYRACVYFDQEGVLYQEMKKIGKFLVDGYPGLTSEKKKALFTQLLESVAPADAELLVAMKNKKIPYKGFGKSFVNEAFPGLIPDGQEV